MKKTKSIEKKQVTLVSSPSVQKTSQENTSTISSTNQIQEQSASKTLFTIPSISVSVSPEFKRHLPVLAMIGLLFFVSLVVYSKVDLRLVQVFDLSRIDLHLSKFLSINFILFLFLFSFSLAASVFYGFKISPILSLLVLPISLLTAFFASLLFPSIFNVSLGLALGLSSAAFFSSLKPNPNFSACWGSVNKAILVMLLIAFLIGFMKVSSDKDFYFTKMIEGILFSVPQAQSSGTQALASAIESISVPSEVFSSTVSDQEIISLLSNQPSFAAAPASERNKTANAVKQLVIEKSSQVFSSTKTAFANQIRSISFNSTSSQFSSSFVKQSLMQFAPMRVVYENFALMIGFAAMSMVFLICIPIQLLASLLSYILAKTGF